MTVVSVRYIVDSVDEAIALTRRVAAMQWRSHVVQWPCIGVYSASALPRACCQQCAGHT